MKRWFLFVIVGSLSTVSLHAQSEDSTSIATSNSAIRNNGSNSITSEDPTTITRSRLSEFMMLDDRTLTFSREYASHTSIWPQLSVIEKVEVRDNSEETPWTNEHLFDEHPSSWWKRKLFYEHLIHMTGDDWWLNIDPVLNVDAGVQSGIADGVISTNQRGGRIAGGIGEQFRFESTLIESQVFLPEYLDRYVDQRGVMIGQGIAKPFKTDGWDHRWASGNISYTPNKHFTFMLGQGKFFYGEGYRSLLLSDNALNYPYFRIETTFGPFKYVNLWSQMYDTRRVVDLNPGRRRKWISSHYLSWNVTEKLNLGFYEAVVFGSDTTNGGLDVSYFNPIIFYRPIEDQIGSRLGNALLGMNGSYKFDGGHTVYGQFILDEFNIEALRESNGSWLNKFGYQIGYRYDHSLTRFDRLSLLAEWNEVRPFTYTHKKVLTNYAHYSQPIAHPLGSDFSEVVLRGAWYHKRWTAELHFSYAIKGLAIEENGVYYGEGADLWVGYDSRSRDDEFGPRDEPSTSIMNARATVAYTINPSWKMDAFFTIGYRSGLVYPYIDRGQLSGSNTWISGGVRTTIFRTYSDI
ncbi:MAG: hypothetical protein HWE14_01215 [Flavobacteriia bacterium]|nr:hypothetical protein [Flavobacteriia bacterium]